LAVAEDWPAASLRDAAAMTPREPQSRVCGNMPVSETMQDNDVYTDKLGQLRGNDYMFCRIVSAIFDDFE